MDLEDKLKGIVNRKYSTNGETREDRMIGDPEGEVFRPDDIEAHASLVLLCKRIADFLEREYSGWLWKIQPDQSGGVINIFSGRMHSNYGNRIHIEALQDDPQLRIVKALAGEMFERFGMPRRPFHLCQAEYNAAPRNAMGWLIPDLSDKADKELMSTELAEQGRVDAYLKRMGGQR